MVSHVRRMVPSVEQRVPIWDRHVWQGCLCGTKGSLCGSDGSLCGKESSLCWTEALRVLYVGHKFCSCVIKGFCWTKFSLCGTDCSLCRKEGSLVLYVWLVVFYVWHVVLYVWHMVFHVWHVVLYVWHMAPYVWHMVIYICDMWFSMWDKRFSICDREIPMWNAGLEESLCPCRSRLERPGIICMTACETLHLKSTRVKIRKDNPGPGFLSSLNTSCPAILDHYAEICSRTWSCW